MVAIAADSETNYVQKNFTTWSYSPRIMDIVRVVNRVEKGFENDDAQQLDLE